MAQWSRKWLVKYEIASISNKRKHRGTEFYQNLKLSCCKWYCQEGEKTFFFPSQDGKKYLHVIYLIQDLFEEDLTNLYNSTIKRQTIQWKVGKAIEYTFLQRRYITDQEEHEKMFNIISHWGNENQSYNEIPLHTNQDGYDNSLKIVNNRK